MIINFDNAATTFPKPDCVKAAVDEAMSKYGGNAGRGGHALAAATSEAVYSAREDIASFFRAKPENTIYAMNCTPALNMSIQGIMAGGGHLIISSMEHNSAARPAARLAEEGRITLSVAEVFPESEKTVAAFRSLIRSDTKAIVCTLAGNVTGQIMPFREIGQLCREHGICFIADGAQACGIIDVKLSDGINILCTAGHKGLYGITGTGLLITDGQFPVVPLMQGGTGTDSLSLRQPDLTPESLESGTVGVIGIMSLKAGVDFVRRTGIGNIFRHEDRICRRFISRLRGDGRITVYRSPAAQYVPIAAFNIEGMTSEEAAARLDRYGYCLRAGFHCAALTHALLGTKNGAVRFSPSYFSREEDAAKLAELINKM
ncbi:MAG: aminotransferase class V-fold PLP-dependent enzyme [Ruminococcus sp.]|nr:aminotransferase class V-fold PLP-dependent enzyme [Ruminococcus sp.]